MKVILTGSIAEAMAKQSVRDWFMGILREFNKAGATAAHAALAAAVVMDGMDMWSRVNQMFNFALAAFLIKGVTGALEFIAKDPVPLDEEPLG